MNALACPYCGKENSGGIPFCPACGYVLGESTGPEVGPEEKIPIPTSGRERFFTIHGRMGRQTFWLVGLGLFCVDQLLDALSSDLKQGTPSILGAVVLLVVSLTVLFVTITVNVKRWHDRNQSGWMILINLIPVVGWVWSIVELGFLKGTDGPNRFGKDPLKVHDDRTEESAYRLLQEAARLESRGRLAEAIAAYENIAKKYAGTAPGQDAARSLINLRGISALAS